MRFCNKQLLSRISDQLGQEIEVTTIFKGEAEPGSEGGELPGTKPHSKVRSLDNVKL